MVGQKLVSKERFLITQKTELCLLLSSNLILFSLMDTGQDFRNKDVLPSGVTEAK